jgi:hypothetical protein
MNVEIVNALKAIEAWISDIKPHDHSSRLSSDEKKQLAAVSRSIELLQKQGVAVPDELRRIKLDLSAKDTGRSDNDSILGDLETLIPELDQLKKQARAIISQFKSIKAPGGPKKNFNVGLEDLIEYGYIALDSRLELQWRKNGEVYEGRVREDGSIIVRTRAGEKLYKSPSAAASELSGISQNGWKHWYVVINGRRTSLEEVRKRYLEE